MRYVERERMMMAVGVAFGVGIGLGLAMGVLMAPESGERTRRSLARRTSGLGDRLAEGMGDSVEWARGRVGRLVRG